MMRRRLEMLSGAAVRYEQVYESSSGVMPKSSEWQSDYRFTTISPITYNNRTNDNSVHLENGLLKLANGHPYCQKFYYVVDHSTALNSYMAFEFTDASTGIIGIHLTDGEKATMGMIDIANGNFMVHTTNSQFWNAKYRAPVTLSASNLFEIEKKGSQASYYLNGTLLWTHSSLYTASNISTEDNKGFIKYRRNAIFTGYDVNRAYLSKMIYRE